MDQIMCRRKSKYLAKWLSENQEQQELQPLKQNRRGDTRTPGNMRSNKRPKSKTGHGKRTRPYGILEENDQETEGNNRQRGTYRKHEK